MKKDWVAVGIIELVGGMLSVLTGQAVLRSGGLQTLVVGWGIIFIVIGVIILTVGIRDKNPSERYCVGCGRPIGLGGMYCHRCDPK